MINPEPDYQTLLAVSQRQAQELALLDQVRSSLARELDLSGLFRSVVQLVSSIFGYDQVSLYLLQENTLELQYSIGCEQRIEHIPSDRGVLGKAVRTAAPILIRNVRQEPVYLGSADGVESEIAIPLMQRGRPVGVLNVESKAGQKLAESDLLLLETLAKDIEIALDRALLHAEVENFARRMALLNDINRAALKSPDMSSLLQVLADRLGELFDADAAYLSLWDDERNVPVPAAAFGNRSDSAPQANVHLGGTNLTAVVLERAQVLAVEDISLFDGLEAEVRAQQWPHAILCLPLAANQRNLGAAIISFDEVRKFTPGDIVFAEQTARQLALAISKVQALEAEVKRTADLKRINERLVDLSRISTQVQAHFTVEEMFETLGEELAKIGIFCLVCKKAARSSDLLVEYIKIGSELQAKIESSIGAPIVGKLIRQDSFPYHEQIFTERHPVYEQSYRDLFAGATSAGSYKQARTLVETWGINDQAHFFILPLSVNRPESGAMLIWGADLIPEDLSAVSIFSNTIAVTLDKIHMYQKIQQMAITDELTGAYNRHGIMEIGKREFDRARRYGRPLSLIILDIDHFKRVNDTFGHAMGDEVLKRISRRMKEMVREMDVIGRYGGEEFLALLPDCSLAEAERVAERMRLGLSAKPIQTEQGFTTLTVSIGVAMMDWGTQDLNTMISNADRAMYEAKNAGRNCVRAYESASGPF